MRTSRTHGDFRDRFFMRRHCFSKTTENMVQYESARGPALWAAPVTTVPAHHRLQVRMATPNRPALSLRSQRRSAHPRSWVNKDSPPSPSLPLFPTWRGCSSLPISPLTPFVRHQKPRVPFLFPRYLSVLYLSAAAAQKRKKTEHCVKNRPQDRSSQYEGTVKEAPAGPPNYSWR